MTLRRLALPCTMALLAAVLMTLPPALVAASPGAPVPAAHAAQDDGSGQVSDDATDDSITSADDVPASCDDASGSAGAGSDEASGDTTTAPAASFRKHGSDDPAGDDSRGRDGADPTPPSNISSDDDSSDDNSTDDDSADDGASDDSGDDSGCDEPVDGVFDFATTEATVGGPSSRTIRTGHAVFRHDGTVRREIVFRTGKPRAKASKRNRGSHGRTVVIAVVQRKVHAGEQVTLDPRLTSAGRKVLKKAKGKTLRTTLKTTFRPLHGKPRTYSTSLLLRR